jgi:hypothetical protein
MPPPVLTFGQNFAKIVGDGTAGATIFQFVDPATGRDFKFVRVKMIEVIRVAGTLDFLRGGLAAQVQFNSISSGSRIIKNYLRGGGQWMDNLRVTATAFNGQVVIEYD